MSKLTELVEKADAGVTGAAKALMKLYVYDRPDDITQSEGVIIACKWYDRWIELLQAKADKGDSTDKRNLADILFFGNGLPEEVWDCFTANDRANALRQSIKLYKEIVVSDEPFCMKDEAWYMMGQAYKKLADFKKAFTCFKKAAVLDYSEAFAMVGDAYLDGKGVEKNLVKARQWFRKGADMGDITATLKLADCYKRGIGCKVDYSKAMDEYLHIAERTDRYWEKYADSIGTALYEIGNIYMNGLGVGIDLKKAYHYFKLAVKKGNLDAENALNGDNRFKNFAK